MKLSIKSTVMVAVAGFLAAVLFASQVPGQFFKPPPMSSRGSTAQILHLKEVEQMVFRFANDARRRHGLPSLARDAGLDVLAGEHSDDMLRRNFFSHINPEGRSLKDRLAPVSGGAFSRTGENIWRGSGQNYNDSRLLAGMIMNSWMSSPGHRDNILRPEYTHTGIGIGALGREILATQVFGQRAGGR